MKKWIISFIIIFSLNAYQRAAAQEQEVQQLLLDVEKLAQLKNILSDLKKGYEILSGGYTTIKNISEGNFKLHQAFLDGLLQVSPVVRNYKRVTDIITTQIQIVREYKSAFQLFKQSEQFRPEEIDYLGKVYTNLFDQSVKNLEALATILTPNELRMSDDERLEAIDGIWKEVDQELTFLRHFNNDAKQLALQRIKEQNNVATLRELYGIDN